MDHLPPDPAPTYRHATYALGFLAPSFRWPASRLDRFKERWFPAWAKRRWPVHYDCIEHGDILERGKRCGRGGSGITSF